MRKFVDWCIRAATWLVQLVKTFLVRYVKWISIDINTYPYRALLKMYGPVLGIPVLAVVFFSTDDNQFTPRPFGPQEQIADLEAYQAQVQSQFQECENIENSEDVLQNSTVASAEDSIIGIGIEELNEDRDSEGVAQRQAKSELISNLESSYSDMNDSEIGIISNFSYSESVVLGNPCRIQVTRFISLSDIDTQLQMTKLNQGLYSQGVRYADLASDDSLADDTKHSYLDAAKNAWASLDNSYITEFQIQIIQRRLPPVERQLQELASTESERQAKTVNSSPVSSAPAPTNSSQFSSDQIRELLSEENGDEIPVPKPDSRLGTQIDSDQLSNTVSEIERTEAIDPLLSTTNEQIRQIQSERLLEIFQIGNSASASEAESAIADIERIQAHPENQVAANDYVFRLRNRIQNIRSTELTALADGIDNIADAQNALNMIQSWQILYNGLTTITGSDANPELETAFGKIQNIENEANQTLSIISEFGSCDSLVNLEIEDFQVNTNVIDNGSNLVLDNILADANLGNQDDTVSFGFVLNGLTLNISLILDSSSEQHSFSQSLFEEEDINPNLEYNIEYNRRRFGTTPDDSVRIHSELRQRTAVVLFEEVNECFAELSESEIECAIIPSFEFSGSSKFGCQFQGSITGESVTYSSDHSISEYTITKSQKSY